MARKRRKKRQQTQARKRARSQTAADKAAIQDFFDEFPEDNHEHDDFEESYQEAPEPKKREQRRAPLGPPKLEHTGLVYTGFVSFAISVIPQLGLTLTYVLTFLYVALFGIFVALQEAEPIDQISVLPASYGIVYIGMFSCTSFGFFVLPLDIHHKVYLFVILLWFGSWVLERLLAPKEGSYLAIDAINLFSLQNDEGFYAEGERKHSGRSFTMPTTKVYILCLSVWCGLIGFTRHWLDIGESPYFYDLSFTYIAGLLPLLIYWVGLLWLDFSRKNIHSAFAGLRFWLAGYLLFLVQVLALLAFFEGD